MDGARIGTAIRDRMRALGLSQADLVRASGVNATTVRELMTGTRGSYRQGTLGKVERALGWPPGHIEEIGSGGVPRPVEHLDLDGVSRTLDAIAEQIVDLRAQVDRLRAAP